MDTPQKNKTLLLLNGPNLNLLGTREPHLYGSTTLTQLTTSLASRASNHDITLLHFQSNHEGALVDRIHAARTESVDGIIINPAAFTHTSVALRGALLAVETPFIEVHITNVHSREPFRQHRYLSDKVRTVVCGMGVYGYIAALEWWAWMFDRGVGKGI